MEEVAEDGLEGLPRGAKAEQGAGGAVEEEAVGDWGIAMLFSTLENPYLVAIRPENARDLVFLKRKLGKVSGNCGICIILTR